MEDALWAQLQNTSLEEHDDRDRIEAETDSDDQDESDHDDSQDNDSKFSRPHESTRADYQEQQEQRVQGPKTGPKGVKADHDYAQYQKSVSTQQKRAEYNARLVAIAPITTTYAQDEINKPVEELLILQHENELLDQDDLSYCRAKRLAELKKLRNNNHAVRQQQKVFGQLKTITAEDYADCIDDEWKTIPVIVHLYDEALPACKLLDDYLLGLSQKYVLAKFIRVSALDLEFDLVGSPAILAYQGGILIANLVRIIDQVGTRFDIEAMEDVLLKYGALSENDLYDEQEDQD